MESNAWAMSESARTDGCRGKIKNKQMSPRRIHDNVAMTLNCRLQASLTFAFEKTSRHKHAFSWASKLPMLGISSLQNIEGIVMWFHQHKPHLRRNLIWHTPCKTAFRRFVVCSKKSRLPVSGERFEGLIVEMEERQGGDCSRLHIELLCDDLLHATQVWHGELALADADEIRGGRHIALFLHQFGSNVKTAHANAGQVFGLHLSHSHDSYQVSANIPWLGVKQGQSRALCNDNKKRTPACRSLL